jgi:hypothetical protein
MTTVVDKQLLSDTRDYFTNFWEFYVKISQPTMFQTFPDRGVIYCAVNSIFYLEAAIISAAALRQFEPDLPILIFSDLPEAKQLDLSQHRIQVIAFQVPPYQRFPDAKVK